MWAPSQKSIFVLLHRPCSRSYRNLDYLVSVQLQHTTSNEVASATDMPVELPVSTYQASDSLFAGEYDANSNEGPMNLPGLNTWHPEYVNR